MIFPIFWVKYYVKPIRKKIKNCNTFYYASAHSLLNLCKFLASSDVLNEDSLQDKNGEIQIMTKIILNYVKD